MSHIISCMWWCVRPGRRTSVATAAQANQRASDTGDWAGIPIDVRTHACVCACACCRCSSCLTVDVGNMQVRRCIEARLSHDPDVPDAMPKSAAETAQLRSASDRWRHLDLLPFSTSDLRHAPNVRFVVPCLCIDSSGVCPRAVVVVLAFARWRSHSMWVCQQAWGPTVLTHG